MHGKAMSFSKTDDIPFFCVSLQSMKRFVLFVLLLVCSINTHAQTGSGTAADPEKEMLKMVEEQVDKMTESLDLEIWQTFYLDSILTNDYTQLSLELKNLQTRKVSKVEYFQEVQDKWMEQMYVSIKEILTPEQWKKYEKMGAAREKKSRDKRLAKAKK